VHGHERLKIVRREMAAPSDTGLTVEAWVLVAEDAAPALS
jgi:hypothetical protein